MNWQPIDTAPKADGMLSVNMLIAAEGSVDGKLVVGEAERDEDGEFWWANERGDYHASPITHRVRYWMPLPAPPTVDEASSTPRVPRVDGPQATGSALPPSLSSIGASEVEALRQLIVKWRQIDAQPDSYFGGCTSREEIDIVKAVTKRRASEVEAALAVPLDKGWVCECGDREMRIDMGPHCATCGEPVVYRGPWLAAASRPQGAALAVPASSPPKEEEVLTRTGELAVEPPPQHASTDMGESQR